MTKLRLAVQKSGRLSEKSLGIIKECGISFSHSSKKLIAHCNNFPIEILYLRDDDIPGYVADGVADIGIVGENVLLEKQEQVTTVRKMGFSRCRLSLAIPRAETYNGVQDFQGKRIATSYPVILKSYFDKNGVTADIHEISGSVEIAPGIGLADAVCDIVSTGSTLIGNGLKEVQEVMRSEAVLVSSPQLSAEKQAILNQLLFRMESVSKAQKNKYIVLNAPAHAVNQIINVLPGMKSPTVTPLAQDDWYSISSVIAEDDFWNVIEQIKAAGAEGILVMPIEKMIL